MDEVCERWLAEKVEEYRREGSRVLSAEEHARVLAAMEGLRERLQVRAEEKKEEGFSPFMYPH